MTRHGFLIEQLRSANPIPETQTFEAVESVDLLELIDERRIDEAYPALLSPTDPPKHRPVLVAALATLVILVVAAAGMVALTNRGSNAPTSTDTGIGGGSADTFRLCPSAIHGYASGVGLSDDGGFGRGLDDVHR